MFSPKDYFKNTIALAPMEDITDISYRALCREMGSDIVYTEFVNADGLVRNCKRGKRKLKILEKEKPVGIQIYGNEAESMATAAKMAEEESPDLIDVNAGCWVKKVSRRGAGAGLLLDPEYMQEMIAKVIKAVKLPVTVKTRIGWDNERLHIVEIAKKLEDIGVQALTVHCRTRCQGHSGDADWSWIEKIKKAVSIPVILNGSVFTAEDVQRAFQTTPCDGVMIARGAIGQPWVFREAKEILKHGKIITEISLQERITLCLRHLKLSIDYKGKRAAIPAFRKYYAGYFKGLPHSANMRIHLMQFNEYDPIEETLSNYLNHHQDDFKERFLQPQKTKS